MNELVKVFECEEFGKVRTVLKNDIVWFVAKDVCNCLEVGNSSQALSRLDADEKDIILTDTLGEKQELSAVNESGLYSLVLSSRKPEAKRFKKWVTSEVLPSIRKVCNKLENIEFKGDMEGLVFIKDNETTTTSLIISRETKKEHSKILRDIDDEIAKIDNAKIGDISQMKKEILYIDSMNRQQKYYEINEQLTMILLARYSSIFRYKITTAFLKMRDTLIEMYQARTLEQVLPQDNRNRQFVYIIGDPIKNIIKIGVAQDVNKRLKQLQTGNSTELEILWTSTICSNAYFIEKNAHDEFKSNKILNEWFLMPVNEVVNYLEKQKYILKSDFNSRIGINSYLNKKETAK